MGKSIWFGTTDHAQWIPAPSIQGYSAGGVGWAAKTLYLNGGANVRRSQGSHRAYSMTWSLKPQAEALPIIDFAQGLLGAGLIYWVDPFAAGTNMLAKDWATPVLGAEGRDGVNVGTGARPTVVPLGSSPHGFPVEGALMTDVPTSGGRRAVILIPPGHDLVLAAFGSAGVGTLQMAVAVKGVGSSLVPWSPVGPPSAATVSRFAGGSAGSWVEVFYDSSALTATATVAGVMAQIVRAGASMDLRRFYSGRGNSGCAFDGMPAETPYSAPLDLVGTAATLSEVGAWL